MAPYLPASIVAAFALFGFVLLLTPTGSLPSARWRWWAWVTTAAPVVVVAAITIAPRPLDEPYQAAVNPPWPSARPSSATGCTTSTTSSPAPLVWGLLTVLLGLGYAGVVLGLGRLLPQGSTLAVAAATLAVAAVMQPARGRIQRAVDRRFNRRRDDAARTIERFGSASAARST